MESVKLSSMDNAPEISLYGSHSFLLFPFARFLSFLHFFFSHHCFGRAPTPKPFHWPADFTHSFTTFLSKNHAASSPLCTHYTLPLKSSDTLYKDLPGTSSSSCCAASLFNHTASQIAAFTSCSGYISLYLFCVNTAYKHERAHGRPHSVFIRAGL